MMNRRHFITLAGTGISTVALGNGIKSVALTPVRSVEYGQALSEFRYGQVTLEPGLNQQQLEETHAVLMNLDNDGLLRPLRRAAGLPAPGYDLAGWYASPRFETETLGQWISALSRYYAISGDQQTREKVDHLVREMALTADPAGQIYAKKGNSASYLYDKLICGLMDAHEFVGQPIAMDLAGRITSCAIPHMPGKAMVEVGESYTIPENQLILWQRGGSQRHLELARQYLYREFFDPLARGENVLACHHAYSHVNSLCSAAKAYLVFGDTDLLKAAQNGFRFLEEQSYATGGWGPNETLIPTPAYSGEGQNLPPINSLKDSLDSLDWHFETPCGSYAHFKLTRYLLRITKDPAYGDSMERVMYNTVMGAKPLLQDGRAFYHSDYNRSDAHKSYYDGERGEYPAEWPCCSGTLPQVAADYRLCIYFGELGGIYVNLFIPSTLVWSQGGVKASISQTGTYPLGDTVTFQVTVAKPREFVLHLRIPAWADQPGILINGKSISSSAIIPGTFAAVRRTWRTGDRVELELRRKLKLKPIGAEDPGIVAVTYDPLVLFGVSPTVFPVTRESLLAAKRLGPESSEWEVKSSAGQMRLVPFWAIGGERYSTYHDVT